jgi:hypothetical protein
VSITVRALGIHLIYVANEQRPFEQNSMHGGLQSASPIDSGGTTVRMYFTTDGQGRPERATIGEKK